MSTHNFFEIKPIDDNHPKGWGQEVWLENNEWYCGKILEIKAGKFCSKHFHLCKRESFILLDGEVILTIVDTLTAKSVDINMQPTMAYRIVPPCPHQFRAIVDSKILEISTSHYEDDSYRIEPGDSQKCA